MVLTKEQNDILTQTAAGTPAGELLRRYWHPVGLVGEVTDDNPTKFVRILSEDLVLFRDKSGNVGLIQDHCVHRGASLLYGRVEERGIACAYHGWLYDTNGNCLETPAEPADSKFYLTVKATAYPVRQFSGFYWTYMGPSPAPEIPQYDVLARTDGKRKVTVFPNLDCTWFAAAENAVDPWHLQILHQDGPRQQIRPANTTRGYVDDIKSIDFFLTSYGIMKHREYVDGFTDEHPMIFPTHLRTGSLWLRTPIDDTHTLQWTVGFKKSEDGATSDPWTELPEVARVPSVKRPADKVHPEAQYDLYVPFGQILTQDIVMWETQGPRSEFRTQERLATSDKGVQMLRDLFFQEIERVQQGHDPFGVIRDPAKAYIDTNFGHEAGRPSGQRTDTVEFIAPRKDWYTEADIAAAGSYGGAPARG